MIAPTDRRIRFPYYVNMHCLNNNNNSNERKEKLKKIIPNLNKLLFFLKMGGKNEAKSLRKYNPILYLK